MDTNSPCTIDAIALPQLWGTWHIDTDFKALPPYLTPGWLAALLQGADS